MVRAHGAELVDPELPVLHPGAGLNVKERSGRLQSLRDPYDDGHYREDEQYHRDGNDQVNDALEEAIEGVFQRLLAQADEAKTVVFEMSHGMPQFLFQIADNQ